jgi:hypothetical protein
MSYHCASLGEMSKCADIQVHCVMSQDVDPITDDAQQRGSQDSQPAFTDLQFDDPKQAFQVRSPNIKL